jgi:hypothetical protein
LLVGQAAAGLGLHEDRLAALDDLAQEPAVLQLGGLVRRQTGLLQVHLVLQLERGAFLDQPNDAADGRQGRDGLVQHGREELGFLDFAARKRHDLLDERLDFGLRALDGILIRAVFRMGAADLFGGSGAHGQKRRSAATSWHGRALARRAAASPQFSRSGRKRSNC